MTKQELLVKIIENKKQQAIVKARENLLPFILYTKPDYVVNWHHIVLCHYLDLWIDGTIRRLMIFAPPRTGKSEIVSRRVPAYIFGKNPNSEIIGASHGTSLSRKMNRDIQRIIDTDTYRDLFPNTCLFGKNIRTVSYGSYLRNSDEFEIVNHQGNYKAVGVGSPVVGTGGNYVIIDDPHKDSKEANSKVYRERIWDWYKEDIYTRLEKDDHLLITNTRRHEDDLAGKLIKAMQEDDDEIKDIWTIISFPAIREEGQKYIVKEDIREYGDALWPWKYNKNRYRKIQKNAGPYGWASLFQQSPTSRGGNLFKYDNFRYYEIDIKTGHLLCYRLNINEPIRIKKSELTIHCYVDPALEIKKTNDPTCMHAWGYSELYKIWLLLDRLQDKIEESKMHNTIMNFAFKNNCSLIGVENEKIGKILVKQSAGRDSIGGKTIPFKEIPTGGIDKYARAVPMATYQENERVFFYKNAIYLSKVETSLTQFPGSDDDHDVDCMSMAEKMESGKKKQAGSLLRRR